MLRQGDAELGQSNARSGGKVWKGGARAEHRVDGEAWAMTSVAEQRQSEAEQGYAKHCDGNDRLSTATAWHS